jgi:tRNA A37 methylthiotransferase MiaB
LADAQKGQTIKVLVEQPQVARSEHDAPDVDCRVLLESALPVGEFAKVTVTGAQVYDVVAKPLSL